MNQHLEFIDTLNENSKYVFDQLRTGHSECTYQKALAIQLRKLFNGVETEKHIGVMFTDSDGISHTIGDERADIFIHDTANEKYYLLELKTTKNMGDEVVCQVNKYIDMLKKNHNIDVDEAYAVNFPAPGANSIPLDIVIKKVK